ncbi:response regulator [Pelomonas sp. SE-A7]|uniref:LytR/AlgR family response regulator transcription factor n=1 Tax=Pelomonas sp. SE-A7 TaxID=3054953 RepID=UPI00259CEC28|nr:response regulator [Pelomonas sp. SE-A7]MDM4768046.1 response regulator [Pelomonas sp. SE-A7]
MRLLIADDEPPALSKLRRLLQAHPDVELVGEAANADEALALLQAEKVDALLTDIQMPGLSGLELALQLPPGVLCAFSTAFDQYAVQAFEMNAVDYLLKPYSAERLAQTLQRLRERLGSREQARGGLLSALQQLQPAEGHWLVPHLGKLVKLPLNEVQWVAAADNYIELHAPPRSYLDRRTLNAFLEHPAAGGFVRVHRSHAVNASHIQSVTALPHGEAQLTLTSGQMLRVSRSYRDQLRG